MQRTRTPAMAVRRAREKSKLPRGHGHLPLAKPLHRCLPSLPARPSPRSRRARREVGPRRTRDATAVTLSTSPNKATKHAQKRSGVLRGGAHGNVTPSSSGRRHREERRSYHHELQQCWHLRLLWVCAPYGVFAVLLALTTLVATHVA